MKATHTPGPWAVAEQTQDTKRLVCADDGFVAICAVYGTALTESLVHEFNIRRDANACLISAAPDLLAALGIAVATIERLAKTDSANGTLDVARAAIAKAKGTQ